MSNTPKPPETSKIEFCMRTLRPVLSSAPVPIATMSTTYAGRVYSVDLDAQNEHAMYVDGVSVYYLGQSRPLAVFKRAVRENRARMVRLCRMFDWFAEVQSDEYRALHAEVVESLSAICVKSH